MKTDIDIKDDIFQYIKGSELANAVTGKLDKTSRPTDSMNEDIIISVEENMNNGIQSALVCVNIYVADLLRGNQYIENTRRLRELCSLAKDVLEVGHVNDARFEMQSQRVKKVNGSDNEHYIENKLVYKHCKY